MLAPSNDWQPSDPCSSSQSSRPMDEYVPFSMLQAPLDVCISVHSCDTSCSSSQSSQSYTLDTTATTAAINDPAKWTVTDTLREYWALHGPTRCYNNDGRYSASKRKDAGGVSRMVTENMFKRILQNGDLNPDAAAAVLCSSGQNAFIVYKDTDKDTFVLAFSGELRYNSVKKNEGEDLKEAVKSLEIKYVDGKYMVEGQNRQNDDVIEAIKSFAATHSPPLLPAFDKNFMTQMSITSVNSDPPPYIQADRALQPDIAPLPNLNELDKDPGVQPEQDFEYNQNIPPSPQYAHGPVWHYYTNHHRVFTL
ncbi:hypothetical protein EMCRGX_G005214 [Ephydatia muelleri]